MRFGSSPWVRAGLACVVLAGGWAGFARFGRSPRAGAEPARVRVEDLVLTVEAEGELAAVRTTDLGPPPLPDVWDFKISFLVPESARVTKGQPVLAFDAAQLEKDLEQKQAEYEEARTQIERRETELGIQVQDQQLFLAEAQAKLEKDTLKDDIPDEMRGAIDARTARLDKEESDRQVRKAQAKMDALKATGDADLASLRSKRDRARGRVEELKASIDAMKVTAPQDGIVIYKSNWRDEKKKVGDSAWKAERVIELPDLSEMMGRATVDEADAGQVRVGQTVGLHLEARPDLEFSGKVTSIGQTVTRKSWRVPSKVYKIEVTLEKTDPAVMRPAMRFRADIETGRVPKLLLAPREAIFLHPAGPVAWVKSGSRWRETPVTLGRSNKRMVEVLSGLADGDQLSFADQAPPERKARGPLGSSA